MTFVEKRTAIRYRNAVKPFSLLLSVLFGLILLLCPAFAASPSGSAARYRTIMDFFENGSDELVLQAAEEFYTSFSDSKYFSEVKLIEAKANNRLGRFRQAALCFETVKTFEAQYYCALAWKQYGDLHKSAAAFSSAFALSGTDSDRILYRKALVSCADVLVGLGDNVQAAKLLEHAFANFSMAEDLEPAGTMLFALYKESAEPDKYISLYEQLSRMVALFDPAKKQEIMFDCAVYYRASGDYDKAWALCAALACDPDAGDGVPLKAVEEALSMAEETAAVSRSIVLETADRLLESYPAYRANAWVVTGIELWHRGRTEEAEKCFARAEKDYSRLDAADRTELQVYAAVYRSETAFWAGDYELCRTLLESVLSMDNPDKQVTKYGRENLYGLTNLLAARVSAHQGDFESCGKYAEIAVQKGFVHGNFWFAFALAHEKESDTSRQWKTVRTIMEKIPEDQRTSAENLLFAEALFCSGDKTPETVERVLKLLQGQDESVSANRAIVLLSSGNYDAAEKLALSSDFAESDYIAGLAAVALNHWDIAMERLAAGSETRSAYAAYYLAYAYYRSGKADEAYDLFFSFCNDTKSYSRSIHDSLAPECWLMAAKTAWQAGKTKEALEAAEKSIDLAKNDAKKTEAVKLKADVLVSVGDFESAKILLEPYAKSIRKDYLQLYFLLAEVYAHRNMSAEAEELLQKIEDNIKDVSADYAEESRFRLGQLYYEAENYQSAETAFRNQLKNYPEGSFSESALYYTALSCEKAGRPEDAILSYMKIAQKEGTYQFAALNRLAHLYNEKGDYNAAIQKIDEALAKFQRQAKSAGLDALKREIAGNAVDEENEIKTLEDEWKSASWEAGFRLAQKYMSRSDKYSEAEKILLSIISDFPGTDGNAIASAYEQLGLLYGYQLEYSKAGVAYLSAAEKSVGNKEIQIEYLYKSMESFFEDRNIDDAEIVCDALQRIAPDSEQARKALQLLK